MTGHAFKHASNAIVNRRQRIFRFAQLCEMKCYIWCSTKQLLDDGRDDVCARIDFLRKDLLSRRLQFTKAKDIA